MNKYVKEGIGVLMVIVSAIIAAASGGISPNEWINIIIAGSGAAMVFTGPNVPGFRYTKAVLAALTAGATFLASLTLGGGISHVDLFQLLVVVLGAAGIYQFPNAPSAGNLVGNDSGPDNDGVLP